jgi:Tfp pilus assembly protein PilN
MATSKMSCWIASISSTADSIELTGRSESQRTPTLFLDIRELEMEDSASKQKALSNSYSF